MRTILVDLPIGCKGFIIESFETGEQCCVLNARYNHETNMRTYQHECDHASHDDLACCEDVNKIEYERHKGEHHGKD